MLIELVAGATFWLPLPAFEVASVMSVISATGSADGVALPLSLPLLLLLFADILSAESARSLGKSGWLKANTRAAAPWYVQLSQHGHDLSNRQDVAAIKQCFSVNRKAAYFDPRRQAPHHDVPSTLRPGLQKKRTQPEAAQLPHFGDGTYHAKKHDSHKALIPCQLSDGLTGAIGVLGRAVAPRWLLRTQAVPWAPSF